MWKVRTIIAGLFGIIAYPIAFLIDLLGLVYWGGLQYVPEVYEEYIDSIKDSVQDLKETWVKKS